MVDTQEALAEVARNLKNIQGSWSYQVFNNIDELVHRLRDKLSESEHRSLEMFFETGVKHPIRRQLGRVNASLTILKELATCKQSP